MPQVLTYSVSGEWERELRKKKKARTHVKDSLNREKRRNKTKQTTNKQANKTTTTKKSKQTTQLLTTCLLMSNQSTTSPQKQQLLNKTSFMAEQDIIQYGISLGVFGQLSLFCSFTASFITLASSLTEQHKKPKSFSQSKNCSTTL